MYGYTTSQKVAAISMLVSIVLYFGANSGLKQNVFIYFFGIALTMLIVGNDQLIIDFLFMNDRAFEYEPHYENWQKRR